MALTDQQRLDALEDAYYSGVKTVEYANGKSVTYRSLSEIGAAIDRLKEKMGTAERKDRRRYAEHSKGL